MGFQQGLSGLNASSKQLEVIGNNVANASTVGFKQSTAEFADVYAASLNGGGGSQIGIGTKVAAVAQQFAQGNITTTSNTLDMAINGAGFFRMDNNGTIYYSRNGQFQLDANGYITNAQGYKLTGYLANTAGKIVAASPAPIQVPTANLNPSATSSSSLGLNLDSRMAGPTTATFSPTDSTSFNNSTSMTIYDSLGNAHVATMYFAKMTAQTPVSGAYTAPVASAANQTFSLTVNGITAASFTSTAAGNTVTAAQVDAALANFVAANPTYTITGSVAAGTLQIKNTTGATITTALTSTYGTTAGSFAGAGFIGTTSTIPAGMPANTTSAWNTYMTVDGSIVPAANTPITTLGFDSNGVMTAPTAAGALTLGQVSVSVPLVNGATTPQLITMDFSKTTQYGANFGVNSMTQNGYTSGQLSGFSTAADGTIQGRYSNGQTKSLGQIVLANFSNPQGLQPQGNNLWVETATSGVPLVSTAGSGSLGVIQSSAVEDSNVDLTAELVNMITAQRVYQANAQSIKTEDAVLQTLVNLR
jgi:flagellar hook protein FlgE